LPLLRQVANSTVHCRRGARRPRRRSGCNGGTRDGRDRGSRDRRADSRRGRGARRRPQPVAGAVRAQERYRHHRVRLPTHGAHAQRTRASTSGNASTSGVRVWRSGEPEAALARSLARREGAGARPVPHCRVPFALHGRADLLRPSRPEQRLRRSPQRPAKPAAAGCSRASSGRRARPSCCSHHAGSAARRQSRSALRPACFRLTSCLLQQVSSAVPSSATRTGAALLASAMFRPASECDADQLGVEVFLDALWAAFATQPAALDAAERCGGGRRVDVVDADDPEP
jgi:hypothetical protein